MHEVQSTEFWYSLSRRCSLSDVAHGALERLRVVAEGAHGAVPEAFLALWDGGGAPALAALAVVRRGAAAAAAAAAAAPVGAGGAVTVGFGAAFPTEREDPYNGTKIEADSFMKFCRLWSELNSV